MIRDRIDWPALPSSLGARNALTMSWSKSSVLSASDPCVPSVHARGMNSLRSLLHVSIACAIVACQIFDVEWQVRMDAILHRIQTEHSR